MKDGLRYIGNAVGMGLIWAVQWAILTVLIGTLTESLSGYSIEKNHVEPLIAMAMPGFIVGVIYAIVLSFVENGRRFDELPLSRIVVCGAGVGLLMGVFPFVIGTPTARYPLWQVIAMIIGSSTLLSTISALGSGLVYRLVARQKSPARA